MTLTDALAAHGISHKPSRIIGKRDLTGASGNFIGTFDAFEGWEYLRSIGSAYAA